VSATISAHQQELRAPAASGVSLRPLSSRLPRRLGSHGGRSSREACPCTRRRPAAGRRSCLASSGEINLGCMSLAFVCQLVRSRLRFACKLICWGGYLFFPFWLFLEGMLFLLRCDLVARGWGSASHSVDDLACLFMRWCAWPRMTL